MMRYAFMLFSVCILTGCGGGSGSTTDTVVLPNEGDSSISQLPSSDTADSLSMADPVATVELSNDPETVINVVPDNADGNATQISENTPVSEVGAIDEVSPSTAPFGIIAYATSEFAGGGSAQSLQVDRYGNIAFYDVPTNQAPVLMTGTLDGVTATQSLSVGLPGIEPSTLIFEIGDLSMAPDRSVAFVARLSGSRPGYALATWNGQSLATVLRTDDEIVPLNTLGGKVKSFSTPTRVVGGLFVQVAYDDGREALVFHDGESFTVVAGSPRDEAAGTIETPQCNVFLGPDKLIFNNSDPVLIGPDSDSVIFQAVFNAGCPYPSAIIRYTGGNYSVVLAEEQPVPGISSASFGYQSLLDVAVDGSVAIQSVVDRNRSVVQAGVNRGFSVSVWSVPFSEEPRLLLVQGESVETDEKQYFLDSTAFTSPALLFRHASGGRYALRGEFDAETALFVGKVRESVPYSSFDTVGAAALEFRISTLSEVPLPYDENAFFRDFTLIDVQADGRLLFASSISTAAQNGRLVNAIWLSAPNRETQLVVAAGDDIPLTTGGSIKSGAQSFGKSLPLVDGSLLFQTGSYLLRLFPDR